MNVLLTLILIIFYGSLVQVILDGIGIFSIVLGKDFISSGFLHSSLYLLLRNLICSNSEIRIASDAVLRVLSVLSGHATVSAKKRETVKAPAVCFMY